MQHLTIYARFSKHEQSEGTSIARQRDDCTKLANERGFTVSEEIIDEGRSAFTGKNREAGSALHEYELEVEAGLRRGQILCVERLDRISRQGYDETQDFVKFLVRNGVTIWTVDGAEVYEAYKRLDMMQVFKMLLKAEVAHEESAKKSDRNSKRYVIRRAEAVVTGRALTKNLPAWLKVGAEGKPVIRDNRDAVIRRIFAMADEGVGSLEITRAINREFEPWTGLNGQTTMQWNRSRISRILADRQVTGEYQPCSKVNGKSVPNGEPWADYFPRIIAQDLFERVNAAAKARQTPAGKRSTVVANLFAGMLRCRECGSWMLFERKRPAGTPYQKGRYVTKSDENAIRCANAHFGKGCGNKGSLSYIGFERAMLDACLHLALDDRAFTSREELSHAMAALAEAERRHEVAMGKAKALWEAYATNASPMAMQLATTAETEAAGILAEIENLKSQADAASGKAEAEAHLSRVAEFREYLYDPDLDVRARHRTKVAQGFRTIIKSVEFDADKIAHVRFLGDLRTLRIQKGKVFRDFNFKHPSGLPTGESKGETIAIKNLGRRMEEAKAG